MNAIDTNVLVRYLVQDHPAQSKAARNYIEKHCRHESPAFVNRIVLCELVWVLSRRYEYSKDQIASVLEKIFRTHQLIIENIEAAWVALRAYRHYNVDFADALIGAVNTRVGFIQTATFDKHAAKLDEFTLLGGV